MYLSWANTSHTNKYLNILIDERYKVNRYFINKKNRQCVLLYKHNKVRFGTFIPFLEIFKGINP
jgi:hypothetical protein